MIECYINAEPTDWAPSHIDTYCWDPNSWAPSHILPGSQFMGSKTHSAWIQTHFWLLTTFLASNHIWLGSQHLESLPHCCDPNFWSSQPQTARIPTHVVCPHIPHNHLLFSSEYTYDLKLLTSHCWFATLCCVRVQRQVDNRVLCWLSVMLVQAVYNGWWYQGKPDNSSLLAPRPVQLGTMHD